MYQITNPCFFSILKYPFVPVLFHKKTFTIFHKGRHDETNNCKHMVKTTNLCDQACRDTPVSRPDEEGHLNYLNRRIKCVGCTFSVVKYITCIRYFIEVVVLLIIYMYILYFCTFKHDKQKYG